jgi:hypothetical protein
VKARAQPRRTATVDRELRELRDRLAAVPRGRGRRFPAPLRARAGAWVTARRARGAEWRALSCALGVPAETLRQWTAAEPPARAVALRAVTVIEESPRRAVTVVAPSGLRIEGITLADAIAILRGLA